MTYHGLSVTGGNITVQLLIAGEPQPFYRRQPDGYLFTAAPHGADYTLRVRNNGRGRIETLVSIDAKDINDDRLPADLLKSSGLCIPGMTSYEFRGYRVDDATTRRFVFGGIEGSAAERSGMSEHTGVISVAAYSELPPRQVPILPGSPVAGQEVTRGGLRANTAAARSMATHVGAAQADAVGRTSFERSGAAQVVTFGYASLRELQDWGIWAPRDPDPWPGHSSGTTGYERY